MKKNKQQTATPMNVGVDPVRTPVMYADAIMMTFSGNGVVLDVAQRVGNSNQASIVSRIGLSKEHAEKLAKMLIEKISLRDGSAITGRVKINH